MSKPTIKDLQAELMSLKVRHRAIEQENNAVKSDCADLQHKLNMANGTVAKLMKEVQTLKGGYALLEEKYYTQSDNYTEINKEYKDLLDKFTEISAENHALKAEIERTNRHINLAENVIHEAKEQQPTVINYHNCTFNN